MRFCLTGWLLWVQGTIHQMASKSNESVCSCEAFSRPCDLHTDTQTPLRAITVAVGRILCSASRQCILIIVVARNCRQSYRHADPRRQQQHTAVAARVTSNRATVTVFVTVWSSPSTFWPLGQCMPSDCYRVHVHQVWCWYSSHLHFKARKTGKTDRQTDRRDLTPYSRRRRVWVITKSSVFQLHLYSKLVVKCRASLLYGRIFQSKLVWWTIDTCVYVEGERKGGTVGSGDDERTTAAVRCSYADCRSVLPVSASDEPEERGNGTEAECHEGEVSEKTRNSDSSFTWQRWDDWCGILTDQFSGSGRAISQVCVFVHVFWQ